MKVVNTKRVGIADLKSRLSEHLRLVRKGGEIIVVDRNKPIARLVPYAEEENKPSLTVYREATGSFGSFKQPPPLDLGFDIVDLLLEDRKKR